MKLIDIKLKKHEELRRKEVDNLSRERIFHGTRNHKINQKSNEIIKEIFSKGIFTQRSDKSKSKMRLRGQKILISK